MIRTSVLRQATGFTLVETLVVIAIIGIATVVAIPYFAKTTRRQKVVSAAHEIQASLLAARMQAVRYNRTVNLVITTATATEDSHRLDMAPVIAIAPAPTPTALPFTTLIDKSAVTFVVTPTGSTVSFSAEGRMISEPAPTPSIITVEGPTGAPITNQVTVQTDSSGKVKVVTPAVWQ